MTPTSNAIQRHKTAIRRPGFSLPIKCLLRDGLLDRSKALFDYGCGHGQDIELLRDLNIPCEGWDPVHRQHVERTSADIVNLGYVINVIENPCERTDALCQAWRLCQQILVVAAQLDLVAPDKDLPGFSDGVLTSRGTFQKYYTQAELRMYLEESLSTDTIPAAPGVFYVFKDEIAKQLFLANRYRRRVTVPPRRVSKLLFEQNKDALEPFMELLIQLGRIPGQEEFPESVELINRFGSLKRAWALVQSATDVEPWKAIAKRRTEDLLVYLALARFHHRPAFSKLPLGTQRDVKAFFGTYERACQDADTLLFRIGDANAIDEACQRSQVGQLVENALLVHRSALGQLEPVLRIYEGCARALLGDLEEADIVKLHRYSGKVSYLSYGDYATHPHPALKYRIKVALHTLSIDFFDYSDCADPPILESKHGLLPPDKIPIPI